MKKTLTTLRAEFKDYYFDNKAAKRVVTFFERELTHQIGELKGQPFRLQKWQRYILRHFFGWKHRVTHLRKYRTLYLEIPRKNGKSILAAGLSLYLLDADREQAARVVCFASNEEQAKEAVFDVAKEMVFSNLKLNARITPYRKSMTVLKSASNFRLLSGSIKGKHGMNLSGLIGDEVHEWESREAMDALRTSMVTRLQPVEIYLTTAGFDKNSLCWELHDHALRLKDGIITDPSFMGVVYAADSDDDWTKEETWRKANPNLGVSVRLDYLRTECEKAKQMVSYENTFKRLHLNIWTEQDSRWMPIENWDNCEIDFDYNLLLKRPCFMGIDLSTTTDIAAIVLLFKMDNGEYQTIEKFYVPEETVLVRTKRDRIPYDLWVKQGYISATPGAVVDYDILRRDINELNTLYNIQEIAMDRWNATQLATQLQGDSFNVCFFGQNFASLSAPTKELSALVVSRKLKHKPNPVMRWMVRNVSVAQDAAGNIKPSKKKSKEKIDGVAALINALGRAIVAQDTRSVYETRGILTA